MIPVSLVGTASYMPGSPVGNEFFGLDKPRAGSGMFRGPNTRHHIAPEETAVDMIERATRRLLERPGACAASEIDLILTNVSLPDSPFTGCGASVSQRLGASPIHILDMHNTGCVSFVFMLEFARSLMTTTGARSALLCNAQTGAGRVYGHPENRLRPQAAVPGDGCGVALLVASESPGVLSVATRSCGEYADDMRARTDCGSKYWEPRSSCLYLDFTESKIAAIVARGNKLVPDIIKEACDKAGVSTSDLDVLVTNQPNQVFLRNWREALQLPPEVQVHTYEEHGNLFGAAIPVCLERAEKIGKLQPGGLVAVGGFSHAGDYAGAAIVRWKAGELCNS